MDFALVASGLYKHYYQKIHLTPCYDTFQVVGAIGDSLTTGLLALGTLQEYKGLSFTGGKCKFML